jgi:glutathione S-transferase
MADTPPIDFHYFDARGRGQFVRYYFRARGVPYSDRRVPLTPGFPEWIALRADRALVGPFHKLPVLRWGDRKVSETFIIYGFLHKALGDEALLSDDENLCHSMLVSTLYVDVMIQIAILLWAEIAYPGADIGALAKRTFDRQKSVLANLETTLAEWSWVERARSRPVMLADTMLWEELDALQHVFGPHLRLDEYPTLAAFYRDCAGRAAFAAELSSQRLPLTGRGLPSEDEGIQKIRGMMSA